MFSGKERDSESGLDYFGARAYSSALGRFQVADEPFAGWDQHEPQSFNLYSYVQNNPLNRVDPDGRSVFLCTGDDFRNCTKISDEEYEKARKSDPYNHAPSLDDLKNAVGGHGDVTDSHGNVVGTANWVPDDPGDAPTEGVSPEGERFLGGLVVGEGVGKVFGAAWGVIAGRLGSSGERISYVIGKLDDLDAPGALKGGESRLPLEDMTGSSVQEMWANNSSVLRRIMAEGKPIRDVSVDSAGNPIKNTGFLRAERNLLQNHGWKLESGYWVPPHR